MPGAAVVSDVVVFGTRDPAGGEEERVELHAQRLPSHVLDWQLATNRDKKEMEIARKNSKKGGNLWVSLLLFSSRHGAQKREKGNSVRCCFPSRVSISVWPGCCVLYSHQAEIRKP